MSKSTRLSQCTSRVPYRAPIAVLVTTLAAMLCAPALARPLDDLPAPGYANPQEVTRLNAKIKALQDQLESSRTAASEASRLRHQIAELMGQLNALKRGPDKQPQALQPSTSGPGSGGDSGIKRLTSPPLPADLSEVAVAGCGDACPTFVILPNPGQVVLGISHWEIRIHMQHRLAVANTETTVGQWKAFVKDTGYQAQSTVDTKCNWNDASLGDDERMPVRCVNVVDAESYAKWFARRHSAALARSGIRVTSFGLPTEVEFEFAARGGKNSAVYMWDAATSEKEMCSQVVLGQCGGRLEQVGRRLMNGYRLYDMIGNLWEWTASPGREFRHELPSDGLELPVEVTERRAVRGAAFNVHARDMQALTFRDRLAPGYRSNDLGFRLVARIAP